MSGTVDDNTKSEDTAESTVDSLLEKKPNFASGDLGKIQQILFGEQWQDEQHRLNGIVARYDSKFTELETQTEQNLQREATGLRHNVDRQLNALTQQVSKSNAEYQSKIDLKVARYDTKIDQLESQTKQNLRTETTAVRNKVDRQLKALEQQTSKSSAQYQSQIDSKVARSDTKIAELESQTEQNLQREATGLRDNVDQKLKTLEQQVGKSSAQYQSQLESKIVRYEKKIDQLESQTKQNLQTETTGLRNEVDQQLKVLKQEVSESSSQYQAQLDSTVAQNDTKIAKLESQTGQHLQREATGLRNDIDQQLKALEQQVSKRSAQYQSQIESKVAQYDTKFAELESQAEHNLQKETAGLRQNVDQQLIALKQQVSESSTQYQSQLDSKIELLQERLDNPKRRTEETSDVLVSAIQQRLEKDEQLGEALRPVVIEKFRQTSLDEPEVMAEALFPILGPAIRKLIASMFTPDKESKKITYRIEQIFLIDSDTGLPLCHAASANTVARDADMVSGMLNAIQSFVHDAFSADEFDGLNTLQVGELSVWIEWGPKAVLAAVIRGNGPKHLREAMQAQLEDIHVEYTSQLQNYDGDASDFEPLQPTLHHFLQSHDGTLKAKISSLPTKVKNWLIGLTLGVLLLAGWMLYTAVDKNRFAKYVAALDAEPGIVVTDSTRRFMRYSVKGLRDPLASDPVALLDGSGIHPERTKFNFEAYQAMHPSFTLSRAKNLLKPPANVELEMKGSILHITGGEADWINEASILSRALNGVSTVEFHP